jgi:DME family drug/metabolite transporter
MSAVLRGGRHAFPRPGETLAQMSLGKMSHDNHAVPQLLLAALVISLGVIAVKKAYAAGASPGDVLTGRLTVAVVLFAATFPFALCRRARPAPFRSLALSGLGGIAFLLGAWSEVEGLLRLSAPVLVMLLYTAPIWVAIFAAALERRWVDLRQTSAIFLAIAGIAFIATPWSSAGWNTLGVAVGMLGALSFAIFLILMSRAFVDIDPFLAISIALATAALTSILLHPHSIAHSLARTSSALYIVGVGLATWVWALVFARALSQTTPLTAVIISSTEPLFVAILAFALLGEALPLHFFLGGAFILAAVFAVSFSGTQPRKTSC